MKKHTYPENHPVVKMFRNLTDRAMEQSSLPDQDILVYLTDMLTRFMEIENFYGIRGEQGQRIEYLIDMVQRAGTLPRSQRQSHYQQIGDYSLFVLGMFPQYLRHPRRCIPHSYYADTGRRSYMVAGELARDSGKIVVFRKLGEKFARCVLTLNWVREYTRDPFYQFMLRQYGII